jgi:hypothetical protein
MTRTPTSNETTIIHVLLLLLGEDSEYLSVIGVGVERDAFCAAMMAFFILDSTCASNSACDILVGIAYALGVTLTI